MSKPVTASASDTLHFKSSEIAFVPFGGPPGDARIARLVGPERTPHMGGGIAIFDGCSIEWTVLYDEFICVLEGKFRLKVGAGFERTIEAGPGDVIWIPENTPLRYEGEKAKVFYTLYPADWKARHGLG